MSENLASALIAFQAAVPTIHENATSFHGKFANLPGVLSTINPALRTVGLCVSQLPCQVDGKPGLRTILMHTSGEHIEDVTPLTISAGKNDTQEWGKAVTYTRRYALQSVLGICVGIEDNDADAEPTPAPKAPAKKAAVKKAEPAPPADAPAPMSSEQQQELGAALKSLYDTDPKACKVVVENFRKHFGLPSDKDAKIGQQLQTAEHYQFMQTQFESLS